MRVHLIALVFAVLLLLLSVGFSSVAPLLLPHCVSDSAAWDETEELYMLSGLDTSAWSQFEFKPIGATSTVYYAGGAYTGTVPSGVFTPLPAWDYPYRFYSGNPFDYEYCYALLSDTPTPTSVVVATVTPTPTSTPTPTPTPEQVLVEMQMYSLAWQVFVGLSLLIGVALLVLRVRM